MKKMHYSWLMVFISGLTMFGMSAEQMTKSIFLPSVAKNLNVGMGTISLAYSISAIFMIFMSPIIARVYRKVSVKSLTVFLVFLQCASLLLYSTANHIVSIAVGACLEGVCVSGILICLPNVVVQRWFIDKGRFAYDIIYFLSMLGGVVSTAVCGVVSESAGWRMAYITIMAFLLVVELPLILIIFRNYPKDAGTMPFIDSVSNKNRVDIKPAQNESMTAKRAWKTLEFYLVTLYCVFISYSMTIQDHISKHLQQVGWGGQITTIMTFSMLGGLIGRVVLSYLGERFGIKVTNRLFCGMGIVSVLILCKAADLNIAVLILMSFMLGMAVRSSTVQMTGMRYRFYGASKDYDIISANSNACSSAVVATSSTVYGFLYDFTGNYNGSFILTAGTFGAAIAMASILLADRRKHER